MDTAEFDRFADEYYQMHAKSIAVTGESPEYFHEYKIADAAKIAVGRRLAVRNIVDFGSGIGNSIRYFRQYFPDATLTCADVSQKSMDLSGTRFPGPEIYSLIDGKSLSLPDNSQDVAFTACVFHHIPHEEHDGWLRELLRVVRPGGILIVFEHNTKNPLTVRAVDNCPFDENAHLIPAGQFVDSANKAGWKNASVRYRIFFPHALSLLRPLESRMTSIPFGAQYCLIAEKQQVS